VAIDEVLTWVMLQLLSDVVRFRRLNLASHILHLPQETGNLAVANENKEDHRRHGGPLSRKLYKQCESPGEEQRVLPVTAAGG